MVHLSEVKVKAFQACIVWIHSGRVATKQSTNVDKKEAARNELKGTIALYLLGDFLDDLLLRNAAMWALVTRNNEWKIQQSPELVNHIWNNIPPNSRLRQMIVDVTMMRLSRSDLKTTDQYPKDLLHTLFTQLLKRVPTVGHATFAAGLQDYLEPEENDA